MGGFLAILSAHRFGASRAIAFAPQWSIDPEIVPSEQRWLVYRENITSLKFRDLTAAIDTSVHFSVFFGKDRHDEAHIILFPSERENIDLI